MTLELIESLYGWIWIFTRIGFIIALIGIFVGFSSWATCIWLLLVSMFCKSTLRNYMQERIELYRKRKIDGK